MIVNLGGRGGELGESADSITDIRTSSDKSIQQFTKKSPIGETHFVGERGVLRGVFGETRSSINGMMI